MAGGEPQVFPGQGCGQARAAAESESSLCPCSAQRLRCPSERLCFPRLKVCRGRLGALRGGVQGEARRASGSGPVFVAAVFLSDAWRAFGELVASRTLQTCARSGGLSLRGRPCGRACRVRAAALTSSSTLDQ